MSSSGATSPAELGVCPRALTSDVAQRLSKLSGLLAPRGGRASSEAGRERQDGAVLNELRKMRTCIERRVGYLKSQVAVATEAADQEMDDEALLFGSGDFLEDGLFLDGFGDEGLFGSHDDELNLLTELSAAPDPPPEVVVQPPPPPPPPEVVPQQEIPRKRQREEASAAPSGKKKSRASSSTTKRSARAYVRFRFSSGGTVLAKATASLAGDSPLALSLSAKHIQKRQHKKKSSAAGESSEKKKHKQEEKPAVDEEPALDAELGPSPRTEKDGATTQAVWAWIDAHAYRSVEVDDLVATVSTDRVPSEEFIGSPLLSAVLADDEDLAPSGDAAPPEYQHQPDTLAKRVVAALVPPADTLTSRRKPPDRETFALPSILDKDASYERCLLEACLDAGLAVVDDYRRFDTQLYVTARACAAKLRRAQALNSTLVANLASAVFRKQQADARQARLDHHLELRWKRFQKKHAGDLKKRKAEAKAHRKSFLPW